MFFEVVSVDSWHRARTEGYGHLPIPFDPGHYPDLSVDTWRPISGDRKTEMKRYFVGGTPELEDLAYCGNGHKKDAGAFEPPTGTNMIHLPEAFANSTQLYRPFCRY